MTPNQFELEFLTGRACKTLSAAREAVQVLHARGPRVVLLTSLLTTEMPEDAIEMLASDADGQYRQRTPKLARIFNGAGDLIAALFFAHYLQTKSAREALSRAGPAVFGVVNKTAQMDAQELQIVAAQNEIVAPSRVFEAEELA